jgi:hypothetical protein
MGSAIVALQVALGVFNVAWLGVERIFFQRHLQQQPATLRHFFHLVRPFSGRFVRAGILVGSVTLAVVFGVEWLLDPEFLRTSHTPGLMLTTSIAAFAVLLDFGLTFVPPALAYTTASVRHAFMIGLAMIWDTWPRSAWYVLCPPLALTMLSYLFPVGGISVRLLLDVVLTAASVLAKGAIAAFYLRERGTYGDDGAAYIAQQMPERSTASANWIVTLMRWGVGGALAVAVVYPLIYALRLGIVTTVNAAATIAVFVLLYVILLRRRH